MALAQLLLSTAVMWIQLMYSWFGFSISDMTGDVGLAHRTLSHSHTLTLSLSLTRFSTLSAHVHNAEPGVMLR